MSCHSISDILFPASGATPKFTTERLTCVSPLRSLEASWLMVLNSHCRSRSTLRRSAAWVIRLLLADSRFFSGSLSVRRSSSEGCILSRAPTFSCLLRACQPLRSRSPSPAGLLMGSIRSKRHQVQRQQRAFALLAKPVFLPHAFLQRAVIVERQPFGGARELNRVRRIRCERIARRDLANLFGTVRQAHQRMTPHQVSHAGRRLETDLGD